MASGEERMALLIHVLVLTRRARFEARRASELEGDIFARAEQVIILGNRIAKAVAKVSAIGAWTGPFAAVQADAEAFQSAWNDDRLHVLRSVYEHAENRVADFEHSEVGPPDGTRRVLGLDIPWWSDGLVGGDEGPNTIRLFGREYHTGPAMAAAERLCSSLTSILVDDDDRLRREPLPTV